MEARGSFGASSGRNSVEGSISSFEYIDADTSSSSPGNGVRGANGGMGKDSTGGDTTWLNIAVKYAGRTATYKSER